LDGHSARRRGALVLPSKNELPSPVEFRADIRQIDRVKIFIQLALLLVTIIFVSCKKDEVVTPLFDAPVATSNWEPTEAQPKLPTMKIYLGAQTLDTELALTERQEQTGMMFRTNIQDTDSMLFVLPYPMRASFWMKNCPESISCAYITPGGTISEIHHLEKNDTNAVLAATDDIQFVLETSDGWFTRHNIAVGTLIRTEKGSLAETFLQGRQ
jgi:uncharacterized membrane protein (UPF0127 family)